MAIAVVGEAPYAEWLGDRADLHLSQEDQDMLKRAREKAERLVVVLFSGRPLIVTDEIRQADAFVAAWLPGSEGGGVVDALVGRVPFSGSLPVIYSQQSEAGQARRNQGT